MKPTTEQIARLRLAIRDLEKQAYTLSATLGDKTLTDEARRGYEDRLTAVGQQKEAKAAEITRLQQQPQQAALF